MSEIRGYKDHTCGFWPMSQHMFTSAVSIIVCQIYVILYIDFRLSMLKSMDLSPSVSYEMYVSLSWSVPKKSGHQSFGLPSPNLVIYWQGNKRKILILQENEVENGSIANNWFSIRKYVEIMLIKTSWVSDIFVRAYKQQFKRWLWRTNL